MILHVIEGGDGDRIALPPGTDTFSILTERNGDGNIEIAALAEERPREIQ